MLAATLPKWVEDVGGVAGFVSCALLVVLLVLYVLRALEIRRLRKAMPFLADPQNGNGQVDE
jgi:hypothetical protein